MSESTSWFPLDLASNILLRLRPRYIARSSCVSKLWSSITTDPYFTSSFETRSLSQPSVVTFFKKRDELFVFSFPQQHQNQNSDEPLSSSSSSSQKVDSYRIKYPKDCRFYCKESVHGLICFQTDTRPIVWNPSTKQFLTVAEPSKSCPSEKKWKRITVFLGYDPIEGKHKVVCLPRATTSDSCLVLTLGSSAQESSSWRKIETKQKHCPFHKDYGRCINGVLYYEAWIDDDHPYSGGIIMSFDVRSEKFDMIKLPSCDFFGMLIPYEGKLACVDTWPDDGITLWVLEDAEKHEWTRKHFLTPFSRSLKKSYYRIDGVTDAGEFICVPYTLLRSFFILYFDPVRNTLRRVEFKGIADGEFRFVNGLGNKRLGRLFTFSNHIDTLMSF